MACRMVWKHLKVPVEVPAFSGCETTCARTFLGVSQEDFLEAVDAVFDRQTVPAEDLHPRFREGRGGDTSILRLVPRRRPP